MNFLVQYVLPFLIPVIAAQLKGGAAATFNALLAGQPIQIASGTVPDIGHLSLQLVNTNPALPGSLGGPTAPVPVPVPVNPPPIKQAS